MVNYLDEVSTGEDEADISLDVWQETFEGRVVLEMSTDSLTHHGVLAHEYDGVASQRHADLLHLFRAYIVSAHDETFWIFIQQLLLNNRRG